MGCQDGSVFDQGPFEQGLVLDEILKVLAPPGYSEHHRGSAIDVGSSDCLPLDEQFETMSAYRWLFSECQSVWVFPVISERQQSRVYLRTLALALLWLVNMIVEKFIWFSAMTIFEKICRMYALYFGLNEN